MKSNTFKRFEKWSLPILVCIFAVLALALVYKVRIAPSKLEELQSEPYIPKGLERDFYNQPSSDAYLTETCSMSDILFQYGNTSKYADKVREIVAAAMQREHKSISYAFIATPDVYMEFEREYRSRFNFLNQVGDIKIMYGVFGGNKVVIPAGNIRVDRINEMLVWSLDVVRELGINQTTTKYDALLLFNNYLIYNLEYNENLRISSSEAVKTGYAICTDYANLFMILARRVGIDCYFYSLADISHAANLVHFSDGTIRFVDVAWNDDYDVTPGNGAVTFDYTKRIASFEEFFLIDYETLVKTHAPGAE